MVMATGTSSASPTAIDPPSDEEAGILLGSATAFLCADAVGVRGALVSLLCASPSRSLPSSPSSHNCLHSVTWRHTRRRAHHKVRLGCRCSAFGACEVAFQRNGYFELIFSPTSSQFCWYT